MNSFEKRKLTQLKNLGHNLAIVIKDHKETHSPEEIISAFDEYEYRALCYYLESKAFIELNELVRLMEDYD